MNGAWLCLMQREMDDWIYACMIVFLYIILKIKNL